MDRNTFDITLRALKQRRPFHPFTVAMVDGDKLEVDDADAIVVRGGTAVFVSPGGAPVIFDFEGVSQIIGDLAEPASPG